MKPENPQPLHLISTLWSVVCRAHRGPADEASAARAQLLERYGGAVQRYLRKLLPDPHAADEVFQEFALQLVHGKLRGAERARGQFRNFVKGTLFHLVADYHKQRRRWPGPLPADGALVPAAPAVDESDRLFVTSWCDELLARAWEALRRHEVQTGQPYYAVLRCRADHPELRSPELADHLAAQLGRPLTAPGVRQILHRARTTFADLLLDEVRQSLSNPTPEHVEDELIALGLVEYCRPALKRDVPGK